MVEQTTGVRVLFTGQHWPGSNSLYIGRAFERCGAVIRFLNETTLCPGWEGKPGRIARRLLRPLIEAEWNNQLLRLVNLFKPDLVYVTNADFCWPRTLVKIRQINIPLMCFYHDVLWKNRPGSNFSQNLPYFDLVGTTCKWQEPEFIAEGAKAVAVVRFGYEPTVHRPLVVNQTCKQSYGAEVTFIGTNENQRCLDLSALVRDGFPYQFRLWGDLWDRLPVGSPLAGYWQGRPVHEQEIPVIYACSQIALHWIGWEPSSNSLAFQKGAQHNSRTFQIAACGGAMMLAQRTDDHLQFFEEDQEAIFFSSVDELRSKLGYWLTPGREVDRQRIAAAARARCLKEDYSWTPVARRFLEHFGLPVAGA